jgi:hypothetical protein
MLTIIVAALTWLLNSAIEEVKSLNLVHYSIERISPEKVQIRITNLTNSEALTEGQFVFLCKDCFNSDADVDQVARTQYVTGAKGARSDTVITLQGSVIRAPANLMPRSTVQYELTLIRLNASPSFLFDATGVSKGSMAGSVVLTTGFSIERFILENYFTIIFWTLIVFIFLLLLWILFSLWKLSTSDTKEGKGEVIHVKIVKE